jgi:hypothetical protein
MFDGLWANLDIERKLSKYEINDWPRPMVAEKDAN